MDCTTNSNTSPPPSSLLTQFKKGADAFIRGRIKSFCCFGRAQSKLLVCLYRFIAFRVHPFYIELFYFLSLCFLGSLAMFLIKPRSPTFSPSYVDMLYMSTSALTVSGLNSVDTELFSEPQILVLALLMLLGGEVFVSLLSLLFQRAKHSSPGSSVASRYRVDSVVELGYVNGTVINAELLEEGPKVSEAAAAAGAGDESKELKHSSIKILGYVVLFYILVFHVFGFSLVFLYFSVTSSAKRVLKTKGLRIATFSLTTVVSSFANGGLIPANENMGMFKKNSILLLMLVPQILAGNTLYPACLWSVLWFLKKFTGKKEFGSMLKNPGELSYPHIFPGLQVVYQTATSLGLLVLQITLFCAIDWKADVLSGLSSVERFVGVWYQSVNTRHAGEGIYDFSIISPAVLVVFIVMMYLPAYTSFLPFKNPKRETEEGESKRRRRKVKKMANLSQLSYIAIFIVVACIFERKKISKDPLNFSTLSLVFEVMSAYGNVGLSMGYSCSRLITPDASCKDEGYSFSGRWSDAGKLLIVFVMLFGRLKRFHMGGGKAWKLI